MPAFLEITKKNVQLTNFGLELFRSGLLLLTSYQKEEKNAKNSQI